ncbi:chromosome segregation protein SMC [Alsobacter sp. SYSU M60028]|uniref:Chromosome partition protein Smc n=1 Tax=Alsobacter ponti TaxID=2962936 RepID=A0ABT1LCM7_9HYPH|nr:chromosome segregation protein SMC [Alsobacter ponti]MCP8939257.1 chromosome segregation protein SMC [Alsobacter ponti]
MKLTRLRLVGFKSFVEATDFLIEPGLTGVVGPNGCGKSNLVEALRWVMGESSYKSLRASGMDDVIFAGSGNRAARNTAEVALLVDNRDRTAPAAFNDADQLDVSRRIERESGSTYRVNGKEVRARDVQLLFADAATGARSPAMVRQGMIGEIIAAKPQARRRILEDAAGIAGLHSRRHEAELRLTAAEDNLSRLADVLQQLDAQIDSLKRQSRQAARYRSLAADIRKAEALLMLIGWREARDGVLAAEKKVEADLSVVAERTRAQAEAATRQAVAAHALPGLRDAEAAAAAALQRLTLARDSLDAEEKRARERAGELERRAVELARDFARETTLIEDAGGALARLDAEQEQLGADGEAAAEAELEARDRLSGLEARLAASEAALAEAQAAVADLNARRSAVERSIGEETEREARLTAELERVQRELDAIEAALGADADVSGLREEIEVAAERAELADEAAGEARLAHANAREGEAAARGPAQEADRAAQRLETEARTLAKLLASPADDAWPRMLDAVRVSRGFETAFAAALGDDLDASTDERAPTHWTLTGGDKADAPLPEGALPLCELVEAPPALTRRLRQVGVVERDAGPALRARLAAGQRLVSREGDLWRWDGLTQAAEAPSPAARRLAEKNRLGELEAAADEARDAAETARAALEAAAAAARAAAQQETRAFDAAAAVRRDLDALRQRLAAAERRQAEVAQRRAALEETRSRHAAGRDEAIARRAAALAQREALPEPSTLESRLAQARIAVSHDRQAVSEVRLLAQGLAREADMRSRRLTAIAGDRAAWEERRVRAAGQVAEIERRQADIEEERETLREAPDTFLLRRRAILSEIAEAETARREAAERLAEAETGQRGADAAAQQALAALSTAREEKARSEARLEAARARLIEVVRTIEERLETTPEGLPEIAGLAAGATPPPTESVERRLDSLRQDRERLGAVNLRAEEELAGFETQRDGLAAEKEDLTEAIKRLRAGIASLNREGRERLLAAFTVVQGHFERLFTSLFGGGTAQLELVESDDPLEAGLEIVARPPGKKPQVMTLLSGGEQALTAIALIFAVFLTNPSPICVLDEVDAPLDDANVERYCDLLREMAKSTETRFIVITHNPITMARMDRLFGVTMAERGVSQLVSVDLETAEQFLEAS